MDFRSMLDQVKSAFVIGKNNPFLHGRQGGRSDDQGYREEAAYQAPQQAYEAGVREGATARTHRVRRWAAAAVTSAGRPSGRRLAKPVPQTIEEAYAQARQELGRRR